MTSPNSHLAIISVLSSSKLAKSAWDNSLGSRILAILEENASIFALHKRLSYRLLQKSFQNLKDSISQWIQHNKICELFEHSSTLLSPAHPESFASVSLLFSTQIPFG
jgi:hypothetical protein